MSTTTLSSDRVLALDGMRGLAVLLVVLFHSLRPAIQSAGVLPSQLDLAVADALSFGWVGVDLFFVLSGYLITGILCRSRTNPHYFRDFYARRTLRIFPLYYVVVALLLFVLPQFMARAPATATEVTSYLTYWSNIWLAWHPEALHTDQARVITWSLAIEEQFYLIWPAVVFVAPRRWLLGLSVTLLVGSPLLRWLMLDAGSHPGTIYVFTPCRIDALAAGALLALWRPSQAIARALAVGALLALAAVFWSERNAFAVSGWMQRVGFSANVLLAGALLVLATGSGIVQRVFEWRWLRVLGARSYAMYLLHVLVIESLEPHLLTGDGALSMHAWIRATGYALPQLTFALVVAAVTYGVAEVSWHVLEKHCLRLKRHFEPVER